MEEAGAENTCEEIIMADFLMFDGNYNTQMEETQ